MGSVVNSLALSFWSYQEIQDGLGLREDWGVDLNLIPFWGDWHDLFCLNISTSQVHYLNDSRTTVFSWATTQDFINSLTNDPSTINADQPEPKLISSSYSDEFRKKVELTLSRRKA